MVKNKKFTGILKILCDFIKTEIRFHSAPSMVKQMTRRIVKVEISMAETGGKLYEISKSNKSKRYP